MDHAQNGIAAIALAIAATLGHAGAQNPARDLAPPTEAVVFKSGQSCLRRNVTVEPGSTKTRLRLPEALHGTAWLGSGTVDIERAIARRATTKETRPVEDMAGMLMRARGHSVRLSILHGPGIAPSFPSGTVLRIVQRKSTASPYQSLRIPQTPTSSPSLVVLRTDEADMTYPISSVVGLRTVDADLAKAAWEYEDELEVSVLDVEHGAPANGPANVQLDAMSDGLAWTPSYVLELGSENKARLVGKAVLVNDAEPLVDTRLRLVVGFPNLQFAAVSSSLRPEVTLNAFRQMLGSGDSDASQAGQLGVMSQVMSNVAMRPRASNASAAGPAQPLAGESAEDLYIYDIGSVTVDRGERLYAPLLAAEIQFEHRYDWDLADRVNRSARFVAEREQPSDPPVWHVLTLENNTSAPWTTAPILIQGKRGPIAQSTLTYTPTASDATVRLTKALDLVGHTTETRTDTVTATRDETYLFGNRYETVEVEGRIELSNRSTKATPVRIRKSISGDILSTDGEPEIRGDTREIGRVNASRTATWSFELAPGTTWKSAYRYRVLIRR